jgi:UDP:flavonoid glycosyltransferase YjiC (YdhE family)
MRILIAAAGSRGDIAPYTGLGAALSRAGYDVALAATDAFAPLAHDAGLKFRSLPADTRACGDVAGKRDLMRTAAAFITELGQGFADATDKGTDLLLLSTTTAPLGWHITEATGTPSLGVYLQPSAPNRRLPARRHRLPFTGPTRQPGDRPLRPAHGRPRLHTGRHTTAPPPRPPPGLPLQGAPTTGKGELAHPARLQHGPWCPAPPTGAPAWTS